MGGLRCIAILVLGIIATVAEFDASLPAVADSVIGPAMLRAGDAVLIVSDKLAGVGKAAT